MIADDLFGIFFCVMKKTIWLVTLSLVSIFANAGQTIWDASWISCPGIDLNAFNVIHLRKTFELASVPDEFVVNLSADNQYRMFVNGQYVCKGPGRSDLEHWYYQTINLAPYLKSGKNVIAVEVVNYGPARGFSQLSHLTAFIMHGVGEHEKIVNTGRNGWKAMRNNAYSEKVVNWRDKNVIAWGLYATNPTDSIVGSLYPWGWEKADYDDHAWKDSRWIDISSLRYNGVSGLFYPDGWLLIPKMTKDLIEVKEQFHKLVKSSYPEVKGWQNLTIDANQKVTLLIDNEVLTLGYPELITSGGKGSKIEVKYAETLFDKNTLQGGNRNQVEGKKMVGVSDVFIPDGGEARLFRPNWFRAFRFIELSIETADEPLVINDYYNKKSEYPIQLKAKFETDNPLLNTIFENGWRTASVCSQDFFLSDAYYEQMQYLGDARVQGQAIMYFSGNDDLYRQMLLQADWSRIPEGLTRACYPDGFNNIIPDYSLVWIDMIADHLEWSGDTEFTSKFKLGIYNVLEWYNQQLQPNGLIGPMRWWPYIDWCQSWDNGVPPGGYEGNSSIISLHYAYTLQKAAYIFNALGNKNEAAIYSQRAEKLKKAVTETCFDKSKGIFADTPEMKSYSQHAGIYAIISGAVSGDPAKTLLGKLLNDKTLAQIQLYFNYYLFDAFLKTGEGYRFYGQLAPWEEMIKAGLSTFTEVKLGEHQRSDCHPWSCSPDIHFYQTVCGIKPLKPGYSQIEIKPNPGALKFVDASLPHPKGDIKLNLQFDNGKVSGMVTILGDMDATFVWGKSAIILKQGENKIKL